MFKFSAGLLIVAEATSVLTRTQSACYCAAPDNCYHSQWAVPCSDASDEAACLASNGQWCGAGPPPPSPPPPPPSPRPSPPAPSPPPPRPPAPTPRPTPSPRPSPSPPPTPAPPAPAPGPTPTPASGILGYWDKTWKASDAPTGANLGVAFNGWANASHALSDSKNVYNCLTGTKYVSIGGGNANGRFSRALVQDLEERINANEFEGWQGIALDIEECSETGLASAFKAATAAAKRKGLATMVTVSHSAPYGCSDASALMQAFFADSNTDYMSPQLYGGGTETSPDFSETSGANVHWSQYVGMLPKLIPSIVDDTHYSRTVDFFRSTGIPVAGYVQWKSENLSPCIPPTTTPAPTTPAPSPTPDPSPTADSFKCVNDQCVPGEGGVPADICSQVCVAPKYKCIDDQCQPSSSGGVPQETCAAICGSTFV